MSLNPLPGRVTAAAIVPQMRQLAALCWRRAASGEGEEVLLVTSSNGRWILPKGWPIEGKSKAETALTEAWEEAGIERGKVARRRIGSFLSSKVMTSGDELSCRTDVFEVRVLRAVDDYPESGRRDRIWVTPERAAELVIEDGLRDILRSFKPRGSR